MNSEATNIKYLALSFMLLFSFVCSEVDSQENCCVELEITGGNCFGCASPGYEMILTPDMTDTDMWGSCTIITGGPSYTGNGYSIFGSIMGGGEGLIGTVMDLNAGSTYVIGFEWQSAAVDCSGPFLDPTGSLIFGIDGDISEIAYSGSGWDELIVCFTAIGPTAEIYLQGIDNTNSLSLVLVDYLPCEYLETVETCSNCCELLTMIDDDASICPGDILAINAIIEEQSGNAIFTWESDPPSGLDYLDDLNTLTPIFQYPYAEEVEEQEFTFTLIIEDVQCTSEEQIIVTVLPSEIPEFDILSLCADQSIDMLPVISENGYSGMWDGPEDFENFENEIVILNFLIEDGQNNCLISYPVDVFIYSTEVAEFSFDLDYCVNMDEYILLPIESDNNIEGMWNVDEFNPFELGEGTHDFFFEVSNDNNCGIGIEISIYIAEALTLGFELSDTICSTELPYTYPVESLEGVTGMWDLPVIDTISESPLSVTNTFTSEENICLEPTIHTLYITAPYVPAFNMDSTICRDAEIYIPPSISMDGIEGIWTPDTVFLNQVSEDSILLSWTPLNSFQCATAFEHTITIALPSAYQMVVPDVFCVTETYYLPNQSSDGTITGIWQQPEITTSQSPGIYLNTFYPHDSLCASPIDITYEIIDRLDPVFNIPAYLCVGESNFVLANLSENNIEGTWNISEIVIADFIGQSVPLEFTPEDSCANVLTISIDIPDLINVQGSYVSPTDCQTDNGSINYTSLSPEIEFSIDNGLSWASNGNFSDLGSGIFYLQYRNTNYPDCLSEIEIELIAPDTPEIDQVITQDNNSCVSPAGYIELLSSQIGTLEFSIDNGVNWQSQNIFSNLEGGLYTVIIRLINAPDCKTQILVELFDVMEPVITGIEITDLTSCVNANGSVTINAEGIVEFSIDNGVSWQSQGLYENLPAGIYKIIVRLVSAVDCTDEAQIEIQDVTAPNIENIIATDVSDCDRDDGQVSILASGQNLEYSIDGGINWQSQILFTGLPEGDYEIIIRSQDFIDCFASGSFEINAPQLPQLDLIQFENPTACNLRNGMIEVQSSTMNVEYSIDMGLTWQSTGLFNDLEAGAYSILVRIIGSLECKTELELELILENESLMDFSAEIINPSECNLEDGGIILTFNNPATFLLSIDGGISFQEEYSFFNLGSGDYSIVIQSENSPLCSAVYTFTIDVIDCPCEDYELSYYSEPVRCDGVELGQIDIEVYSDETILWDNGMTTNTITELNSGWYYVTISYDNEKCSYSDSIYVDAIDPISFSLEVFPSDCESSENGSINIIEITGGQAPYNYSIDNSNFQSESGFYNLSPDNYEIYVKDLGGCIEHQNAIVEINSQVEIILPNIVSIEQGESITLNPLINESSIDSFLWAPITGITAPSDLVIEVSPEQTTLYTLRIYYGQCVEERTILVEVIKNENIYIANIFSPNGDGSNDILFAQSNSISSLSVLSLNIYDKWGNLVFTKANPELNNSDDGWDGRQGYEVVAGVFVYQLIYVLNGEELIEHGTVTLVR